MMKKYLALICVTALVSACTSMTVAGFNTGNTVGRDVDEVIADIKKSGLSCGQKYKEKVVNSGRITGSVNCGLTQKLKFCSTSYGVYLSYDLLTSKVTSIFKDERDNCF